VRERLDALPTRALVAIAAGAVLLYALVLWFLLVSPKRSEAASLSEDVASAQVQLATARVSANHPRRQGTHVADVLELEKAMPSSTDQAGLVLELDRLARVSGVSLSSITPSDPVLGAGGTTTIPVVVNVDGSYRQITRFLKRTRELVRVRGGVRATGRLLTVQSVELSESTTEGFPRLAAAITLNAFVYDGPIVPATPPAGTSNEQQSTSASAANGTP
jgi:Tfp pilus assembly protein PilO